SFTHGSAGDECPKIELPDEESIGASEEAFDR
ncbi:hypothetical protein Tco_1020516, partial [Tanacetum coccineum]